MLEEGLPIVVVFMIVVALSMNQNIRGKIDRGWIVSTWSMILFLIFCMATGILGSYLATRMLIHFSPVSEYMLSQEFLVFGALVIILCLVCYGIIYYPVFAKWRRIMKKTISEDAIGKLRRIVKRLNEEADKLLEETQSGMLTEEMTEKMQNLAAYQARLDRLEKSQRSLSATKILNIFLLALSIIIPIVLEVSRNTGG